MFFTLPERHHTDTYIFTSSDDTSSLATPKNVQAWTVPVWAKFIYIMAIGAGGFGGNGGAGTNGGGGGGGSAAVVATGIFPTVILPDILYVRPGIGARGPSASSWSIVTLRPSIADTSTYLIAAYNGGGGGNGTSAAAGSAGTAGTGSSSSLLSSAGASLGICSFHSGNQGGQGGLSTAGLASNSFFGFISGGGGGGQGGSTSSPKGGGNTSPVIIDAGLNTNQSNGLFGSVTQMFTSAGLRSFGAPGQDGTTTTGSVVPLIKPGIGAGGAGGGGVATGGTATGGPGGDGMVLIKCW